MDSPNERARSFLAGEALSFVEADLLWRALRDGGEPSLARSVLSRLRESDHDSAILLDSFPAARTARRELCLQEAMLTSKDEELSAAVRHSRAIELLVKEFGELNDPELQDPETLGIAAGIFKRKWFDLGPAARSPGVSRPLWPRRSRPSRRRCLPAHQRRISRGRAGQPWR